MAQLGSEKNPLYFTVKTEAHAFAIMALCEKRGWKATARISPDEPEDTSDLDRVRQPPPRPIKVGEKIGRNDPCTCGSGKKYKKCCGLS